MSREGLEMAYEQEPQSDPHWDAYRGKVGREKINKFRALMAAPDIREKVDDVRAFLKDSKAVQTVILAREVVNLKKAYEVVLLPQGRQLDNLSFNEIISAIKDSGLGFDTLARIAKIYFEENRQDRLNEIYAEIEEHANDLPLAVLWEIRHNQASRLWKLGEKDKSRDLNLVLKDRTEEKVRILQLKANFGEILGDPSLKDAVRADNFKRIAEWLKEEGNYPDYLQAQLMTAFYKMEHAKKITDNPPKRLTLFDEANRLLDKMTRKNSMIVYSNNRVCAFLVEAQISMARIEAMVEDRRRNEGHKSLRLLDWENFLKEDQKSGNIIGNQIQRFINRHTKATELMQKSGYFLPPGFAMDHLSEMLTGGEVKDEVKFLETLFQVKIAKEAGEV